MVEGEVAELWKDIKGFSNYQVSNKGRVRNKDNMIPTIRNKTNECGYYVKKMYNDNDVIKTRSVHELVAKAFLDNPNNNQFVIHKDANKLNNCVDNLEWGTRCDFFAKFPKKILAKRLKDFSEFNVESLEGEEWKKLHDFPAYYVSNFGRIFNCFLGKFATIKKAKYGHNIVHLKKQKKTKNISLNRVNKLVAENFIDNPNNYYYVIHKDGNNFNDHVDNLKWISDEEKNVIEVEIKIQKLKKIQEVEDENSKYKGEIWTPIEKYDNYEVSNFSRVRNRFTNKIKDIIITGTGFSVVLLWKSNKATEFKVHRLVAEYFIDNPNKYKYVEHIDQDKSNNNINNLRWTTHVPSYNIKSCDKIQQINIADDTVIKTWDSYIDICEHFSITYKEINDACDTDITIKDYKWKKYVEADKSDEVWKVWKDYEVSNYGKVRNKITKNSITLKKRDGYMTVGYKKRSFLVHRLVAMCFLLNPKNKLHVNHKDRNRSNNNLNNLEWATHEENMRHARETESNTLDRKTDELSIKIDKTWDEYFDIINSLADSFLSVKQAVVDNIILMRNFYHKIQFDLPNEIWKSVKTTEDYKVSNYGRVKSTMNGILKQYNETYRRVHIRGKTYQVHILVATIFIPNPDKLPIVNHKDSDKYNNRLDNLEWITHLGNIKHAIDSGCVTYSRAYKIDQYALDGKFIKTWDSLRDIQKELGIKRTRLARVLKNKTGETGETGGYIWKFAKTT